MTEKEKLVVCKLLYEHKESPKSLLIVHKRLLIVHIVHVDFDESAVDGATHSCWEVGHLVELVHHLPALVLILWPLHCALEQLPVDHFNNTLNGSCH